MLFEVDGWGLENRKVKATESNRKIKQQKQLKRHERLNGTNDDSGDEEDRSGLGIKGPDPKVKREKSMKDKKDKKDTKGKDTDKKGKRGEKRRIEENDSDDGESATEEKGKPETVKYKKPQYEEVLPPADVDIGIDASKLTPLQRKMLAKLSGSRFRWINEQLYTQDSESALKMIEKQPELYEEYHKGFASQVESWPENPVDVFTRELVYRGVSKMISSPGGLPGIKSERGDRKVVVADMGCGEANLAKEIDLFMQEYKKKGGSGGAEALKKFKKKFGHGKDISCKNKRLEVEVHSFDLKKINEYITVADIKNVPLKNETASVVIFCLSLMGTNFLDFIAEADRILIKGGELWITEIKSRLSDPKCTDFIKAVESLGFKLRVFDDANKMFTRFEFYKPLKSAAKKVNDVKELRKGQKEGEWLLKPCIYKRR